MPNLGPKDLLSDLIWITYIKPSNASFKSKNESVQYRACIKETGAIQKTP